MRPTTAICASSVWRRSKSEYKSTCFGRCAEEAVKVVEDEDDGARLPLAAAAAVGAAPRLRAAEEVEDEAEAVAERPEARRLHRCEHAELPRDRVQGGALVGKQQRVQVDAEVVGAAGVGAERVGGGGGVGARRRRARRGGGGDVGVAKRVEGPEDSAVLADAAGADEDD